MVERKISRRVISEFYQDILRWEAMLGYASDELLFLDKLLHAKAFEDTIQLKTEKILRFKLDIKTKNQEVNDLMAQIGLSKEKVGAYLECEETAGIEFSFENYKFLKQSFANFTSSYNQYKTEIFKLTGGIL